MQGFGNTQKIGKMYLISGANKAPSSVITSHLWMLATPCRMCNLSVQLTGCGNH